MKTNPTRFGALVLFGIGLLAAPSHAQGEAGGMPDMSDFGGAIAQQAEAAPPKKAAPIPKTGFASGLAVPRIKPGQSARLVFTELRKKTQEAAITQPEMLKVMPALLDLEKQAPAILTAIEKELLLKAGLAPRDMGTAYAVAFLQLREDATGQKTTEVQDKAAALTLSKAIGMHWAAKWKTLSPAAKESMYEQLLMSSALSAMLIGQFTEANRLDEVATLRQGAGETFVALVGVPAEQVMIAADGQISGLRPGQPEDAATAPATDEAAPEAPADAAPADEAPADAAPEEG